MRALPVPDVIRAFRRVRSWARVHFTPRPPERRAPGRGGRTIDLIRISRALRAEVAELRFGAPVTHIYNPLDYAWRTHRAYLARFGAAPREVLLVGMNPGPWGMAQTGVPFGDPPMVCEWMGLHIRVAKPVPEHPKRPVEGCASRRREVSGRRLWGWARERFGTPQRFFARFFVLNYCPLCFLEASGRNRTPDKLPAAEREPLFAACDRALRRAVDHLEPQWVIGIGRFAATRIETACRGLDVRTGSAPHPSPANPAANRGWAPQMERALRALGVRL